MWKQGNVQKVETATSVPFPDFRYLRALQFLAEFNTLITQQIGINKAQQKPPLSRLIMAPHLKDEKFSKKNWRRTQHTDHVYHAHCSMYVLYIAANIAANQLQYIVAVYSIKFDLIDI